MSEGKPEEEPPKPRAGWYADPEAPNVERYWDGDKWTARTRSANARASWSRVTSSRVRLLAGCGAIGLVVSPFLPWVSVLLIGDLNLFELLDAGGNENTLASLMVLVGAAVAVTAYLASSVRTVKITSLLVGLIAGIYLALVLTGMVDDVEEAQGLVRIRWGPYLAVAACVAMAVAGAIKEKGGDTSPQPE